jgi:hypothetical protein
MPAFVTITDPRHPLFGRQLKLLSLVSARGPAFVTAALPDGRRRFIPRAITDLQRPLASQETLPRISARTLLPLARLVRSMLAASTKEASHASPSEVGSSVKAHAEPAIPSSMGGNVRDGAKATRPATRSGAATNPRDGEPSC